MAASAVCCARSAPVLSITGCARARSRYAADIEDSAPLLETLHAAEADAWRALNALSFDFDLLLPAEEADLDDRVAALAAWCHGFVTG